MDRRRYGILFLWVGLVAYAASFFLSFAGGRGVYTPKPPTGADCAIEWFFFPWVYIHWHDVDSFWKDAPIQNASVAISGLINPVFFLSVLVLLARKTPQLTRILRYLILLMLPFCWVVFLSKELYPREGYFLWIGGMVLVLFSGETGKQRFALESEST
jgi:hypothetical protein